MACIVKGTAFITGGGSGIGKATALAFAKSGISALALADLNISALESTRHEIETLFPDVQVETLQVNVADEVGVDSAVRKSVERFGSIEIGINCAGISGSPTPTDKMSLAEWQKVIDINQTGLWLSQRALIRQMLTQESRGVREGRGCIVNVSSMFGIAGPPPPSGISHYTAAKHAVIGLTRMDAKAYSRQGIRINAICPGFVDTPILNDHFDSMKPLFDATPIGRPAQVEEISDALLFLSSPMSSYMCGAALVVDGGNTV
ncbi:uncharacterized protein N7443_007085 [Penicillium atrosanguineum]|uniref:Uncharacterized protein n=1 Tax=Penicillium atrosanguineum TaxID=1132637 RepID=A0A9W9Q2P5_9EURO|nr:uncharacterized protein N7443_007085 [Penicillium atrosanguineum]KAJ5142367.1 hypothetical protein N7526_003362 [Penicillium atrosanguineum]KAJ5298965.1 hypothetical protein N7443_007085 [Penicillium atrosanguineum]KAJ5320772.1 hypothetical protein N7476_003774 [Penicillium atrosanguineum]